MASEAHRRLGLHQVWLLVSPQNPLKSKKDMADFRHRYAMCKLMAARHPWLKVSDFEQRTNSPFTAQTLKKLQQRHKNDRFVWLMGSDNLAQIHKWQNWRSIFNTTPVAVFLRKDVPAAGTRAPAAITYRKKRKSQHARLGKAPEWRLMMVPPHHGRATVIRRELHRGRDLEHLSEHTRAYIARHHPYEEHTTAHAS